MEIAIANGNKAALNWERTTIEWPAFVDRLRQPSDRKECGQYVLGGLSSSRRSKSTIITRSALTLDADSASSDLPDIVEMMLPYQAVVHTTFNHSPNSPRYRIIMPFAEPIPAADYDRIANHVIDLLGREQFDPGSTQPERYMFWPAAKEPELYTLHEIDGPTAKLSDFDHVERSLTHSTSPRNRKQDPFEITGIVGDFCRAYSDISEAIELLGLPYEPGTIPGRWTLKGAQSLDGLHLIADGVVYSHHQSDPAKLQACNIFDLARIHKFGDEDLGYSENTVITQLPSHDLMVKFATKDRRVFDQTIGQDFLSETETDGDYVWQMDLKRGKDGKRVLNIIQNWELIFEHWLPPLRRNKMNETINVTKLPWRKVVKNVSDEWTGEDLITFRISIEKEFDLKITNQSLSDYVEHFANENEYHPIKNYLDSLQWDGISRLEECLPGVTPSDYSRMVARKCHLPDIIAVEGYEAVAVCPEILSIGQVCLGSYWNTRA